MKNKIFILFFLQLFLIQYSIGNEVKIYKNAINNIPVFNNIPPVLTATGNQIYCSQSSVKIVTDFTIFDPDDSGVDALYIQISTGYVINEDGLVLSGIHPNINTIWDSVTGKLTLTGVTSQPTYTELIAAVKDVEFSTNNPNPSGSRTFSITVGQANFLPSNGHYYEYKENIGISWSEAKILAQNSTYFGLQGYLATISSEDEAQIAGEQTTGAGWIGGSDDETEGIWKWKTGPENGLTFWNGNFTGFTTNFAFWNTGEPNNANDEDYAHITAVGIGITGSWNDLSNTGESSGAYQPKGYVVEYGGMPGDPILNISASTTLLIPSIISSLSSTRCGLGSVILEAISNTGTVKWYTNSTGGLPIHTGNSFTTPPISQTTVFYMVAHSPNCPDSIRIPISAFVTQRPILTANSPYYMCEESYKVIEVLTTAGIMFWFDSPTSTTPIFLGTNFVVPNINIDTIYYAEANNNGCLSERIPIQVFVYQAPDVEDENIIICQNQPLQLDAGVQNVIYQWSTGENTQTILHSGLPTYTVTLTTLPPESCSRIKTFQIYEVTPPEITNIEINNLTVTIQITGIGEYEYSLDGVNFQTSNIFTVPEGGIYSCIVRETSNNCGSDINTFIVVSFPVFFTPNNDSYNDTWTIKGISNYSEAEIKIYDRFGKLIFVLNSENPTWDGTYKGASISSSDYWYVAKINSNLPEVRGHFTLKR